MSFGTKRFFIIFELVFFIISSVLLAEAERLTFRFSREHVHCEKRAEYDIVTYDDFELSQDIGAPQLPRRCYPIPLSPGKEIVALSVRHMVSEELPGEYLLFPVQRPQMLSQPQVDFTPADVRIYASTEPFPKEIATIVPSGHWLGDNIGAVLIYPLQYIPSQRKLRLISHIDIELVYGGKATLPPPFKETPYSQALKNRLLKRPEQASSLKKDLYSATPIHHYLIITANHLRSNFLPMAQWKTQKGLNAKIVTVEEIHAQTPGKDLAEKIRNFLIEAHRSWGTIWVLLGGDTNIIPARYAYAFDCETGRQNDNQIPCDLYFADLDGNWDADGDGIFGEITDDIDMYPDIFVGRAAIENAAEADAFVGKVLTYETSAPQGHELNMLFLAEVLWTNPYTNSGEGKDHIDRSYVPARFDPITKLYKHLGNETIASALEAINRGQNIINHDGHAWYTVLSVGDGSLRINHIDDLRNGPKYSILFSIGCWPAAFDYDCIAEHFITNAHGGGVAFIGNSRYGWGSPGNPLYGYSDRFDQQFFKQLFIDEVTSIGAALSAAKAFYVPFARQENVYRWCEYEINLLGDPEMPIWTDRPHTIAVSHPRQLPLGTSPCDIYASKDGQPLAGALVCVMQDSTVYATGLTGADGSLRLNITAINPAHPLQMTVTAANCLPLSDSIFLSSNQAAVFLAAYAVNGSVDKVIKPGAEYFLDIGLKNYGQMAASGIECILSCQDHSFLLSDSSEYGGVISAGDSLFFPHAFAIRTPTTLTNGQSVGFELKITDAAGHLWQSPFILTAGVPLLTLSDYAVKEASSGDGDGLAEAGETVTLSLSICNQGLTAATAARLSITTADDHITVPSQPVLMPTIRPKEISVVPITISIAPVCPIPKFVPIEISILTADGYSFDDSLVLAIGPIGFTDDMENGPGRWTHSGDIDLWHVSNHRQHSGNFSWYCGDAEKHVYKNHMENSLISTPFVVDANSQLCFWCWYQCPNYGVNGIYLEVNDGSGWQKLDFIGSGGALSTLPTGNDWLEYVYDLSAYPAGSTLQLRFRFVSDKEAVTEGVYIDDVVVRNKAYNPVSSGEKETTDRYELWPNHPNPFNAVTTITFSVPQPQPTTLTVYDLCGRKVATLLQNQWVVGRQAAIWDARSLPSGIYFYRLQSGAFSATRKCLLLR